MDEFHITLGNRINIITIHRGLKWKIIIHEREVSMGMKPCCSWINIPPNKLFFVRLKDSWTSVENTTTKSQK